MARLYKRIYKLTVTNQGTGQVTVFEDLRLGFKVSKSIVGEPDLAELNIYNLSKASLGRISDKNSKVVLEVGYLNSPLERLFVGDLRNIITVRSSVDKISTIYAGNAQRVFDSARFTGAFSKGTPLRQILQALAEVMPEVELGSLDAVNSEASNLSGVSYAGSVKTILDTLGMQHGFNWAITDNVLRLFPSNKAIREQSRQVVVVSPSSGMIGAPTITEIGADVTTLLSTDVIPNGLVKIESATPRLNLGNLFYREVNRDLGDGLYKVNKVTHIGDTRANDWKSDIVGQRDFTF